MLRKETANDSIMFEIKNIVEETKTNSFDYYDISTELEEFNNGRADDNRITLKRPISEPSPETLVEENLSEKGQKKKSRKISFKMIKPLQKQKKIKSVRNNYNKITQFSIEFSYS